MPIHISGTMAICNHESGRLSTLDPMHLCLPNYTLSLFPIWPILTTHTIAHCLKFTLTSRSRQGGVLSVGCGRCLSCVETCSRQRGHSCLAPTFGLFLGLFSSWTTMFNLRYAALAHAVSCSDSVSRLQTKRRDGHRQDKRNTVYGCMRDASQWAVRHSQSLAGSTWMDHQCARG